MDVDGRNKWNGRTEGREGWNGPMDGRNGMEEDTTGVVRDGRVSCPYSTSGTPPMVMTPVALVELAAGGFWSLSAMWAKGLPSAILMLEFRRAGLGRAG